MNQMTNIDIIISNEKVIAAAHVLERQRTAIDNQIDALLTPIITEAMSTMTIVGLTELMWSLPPGFHRSELRHYINVHHV